MLDPEVKQLSELCDPSRGITYGIVKVGEFVPGGVPVIRGGDIRDGRIVISEEKRVTREVSDQFRRTILRGREIVINLISEPGHTAVVPPGMAGHNVSRDVAVIPLTEGVNHKYIDYYLKSPAAITWLESRLQGSVTSKINLGDLKKIPIPLPDQKTQNAISDVLSALDEKIELNRRMNETLEAMAQAIFRDWFVDFGPVRRKLEGASDPVAVMGGLTPDPARAAELSALFPDRFADNGLPEGWSQAPLDRIAEFLNGLALQKFPARSGAPNLPVIKIAELRNGISPNTNRASLDFPDRYRVKDGDFLFSWSGSLLAKVWTEGPGALNQHLFKVTSANYPQWFFARWALEHLADFESIAASKATTMGHIQRGHLAAAMTVCPPVGTIRSMSEVMSPIWARMIHNDLENRTLAETRDYLLPKLMSGQVRVLDAAAIAEAAA